MAATEERVRSGGGGIVDRPPSFLAWLAAKRAAGEKRTGGTADLREYMRDVWGRR